MGKGWLLMFVGVLVMGSVLSACTVAGPPPVAVSPREALEAQNLAVVEGFFQALVVEKDAEAVGTFLSDDFVSHTPGLVGKQGMMEFAAWQAENDPGAGIVEIFHKLAQGDTVVWHYSYGSNPAAKADMMITDFFTVKDGKITAYWDVLSPIEAEE